MKKKDKKAEAERARKEAWLARSRQQPGASVGDMPMMNADDHSRLPLNPFAGSRIGDS